MKDKRKKNELRETRKLLKTNLFRKKCNLEGYSGLFLKCTKEELQIMMIFKVLRLRDYIVKKEDWLALK